MTSVSSNDQYTAHLISPTFPPALHYCEASLNSVHQYLYMSLRKIKTLLSKCNHPSITRILRQYHKSVPQIPRLSPTFSDGGTHAPNLREEIRKPAARWGLEAGAALLAAVNLFSGSWMKPPKSEGGAKSPGRRVPGKKHVKRPVVNAP